MITGYDVDEVFYKTCVKLLNAPITNPRNQQTKEIIKPQLIIYNPLQCVITNPARKLSYKYLRAELNWYDSGDKSVKKIRQYSTLWDKIKDKNGKVNSNYGEMVNYQKLLNYDGSQFDWVVNSLIKDKDSRQAVINFNQPKHKYKDNPDMPCTMFTQYLIRDNKLIGITDMRSNDLIYGFCYDFPFFVRLQHRIWLKAREKHSKITLGRNIHNSTSMHIYKHHFDMMEQIIKNYENSQIKSKSLNDI